MTACNNNVRGGKASRVITAALVATLSVGTPMAAIASTVSEGGIDMLATDTNDIAKGTVAYKSGAAGDAFVYNGEEQGIVPSTLTPYNSSSMEVSLLPASSKRVDGDAYYWYVKIDSNGSQAADGKVQYKDSKGKLQTLKGTKVEVDSTSRAGKLPTEVGEYAVVVAVKTSAGWDYVSVADTFSIVGNSLKDAVLCNADDAEDTTFAFTGATDCAKWSTVKSNMAVALDGALLKDGSSNLYTIDACYEKSTGAAVSDNTLLKPGTTYSVKVTGKGAYADEVVYLEFTYKAMDLSSAEIDVVTGSEDAPQAVLADIVEKINGKPVDSDNVKYFAVTLNSTPDGAPGISDAKGEYSFTISAAADQDYVTGSQTVKVMYANYYPEFTYNGSGFESGLEVNLSQDADEIPYFDSSLVKATYDIDKTVPASKITYSYEDEDGNAATAADLKTPGTWIVKATVNFEDEAGNLVAATDSLKVTVNWGNITTDEHVYVSVDGVNVSSTTEASGTDVAEYSGENYADSLSVKVTKGDKTFEQGVDYTVALQVKDAKGKWVDTDEAVNAGNYRVAVKPLTFDTAADTVNYFYFDINQVVLGANVEVVYPYENTAYYPYTGSAITPSFKFVDEDKNEVEVPADAYDVTFTNSKGKESDLVEADTYTFDIEASDANVNFDFSKVSTADKKIVVSEDKIFNDVQNNTYYTDAVYYVASKGYMVGNAGMFNPEAKLNRYQLATVLMNIAEADPKGGIFVTPGYNENQGVVTGFSDVDGHMHYATAIAWAHDNDLVQGYGDGTFGPEDSISREQFAQMLFNYAKKVGVDTSVDTEAVLAKCNDGAAVNDWAREAVAWAVDNGLMAQGSDIMPTTTITRAQAAIMVMRFDGLL